MNANHARRLDRWNRQYFSAALPASKLDLLAPLVDQPDEVVGLIERFFARAHDMGLPAEDVSELLMWEMGSLLPRILPTAWGGMVPPITVKGRHELIENYLAGNRWYSVQAGDRLLDIGCGFPPLTAVDLATRFADCTVIGADPQFGRWMVYDEDGDYACFRDNGDLRYFQPGNADYRRWDEMHRDPEATRARFENLLTRLRPQLGDEPGNTTVRDAGARLVQDPIDEFARDNLTFIKGGFGDVDPGGRVDVVRSMNVLVYFGAAFRQRAVDWIGSLLNEGGLFVCGMNWARSVNSRYSIYQKEDGAMVHREFALGLECVRPLEMVPLFAFHDDEIEFSLQRHCVRTLRKDEAFLAFYNAHLDALQEELALCPRGQDGHLGGMHEDLEPGDLEEGLVALAAGANNEQVVAAACEVLSRAGLEAWRNEAGHPAIKPPR